MYFALIGFNPHDDLLPMSIRELRYHQIIQDFPSPEEECYMVPSIVSEIVMKLLDWSSDERYQSAAGLLADFEKLLSHDDPNDKLQLSYALFNIDSMEMSDQVPPINFHIPKSLLRRGKDLKAVVANLEQIRVDGMSRVLFVSGPVGIGKSSFLSESENYAIARRAFWIQESAQDSDGIPYYPIRKMLETIANEFSALEPNKKMQISDSLIDQLGGIGKLLINLAPSLVVCRLDPMCV